MPPITSNRPLMTFLREHHPELAKDIEAFEAPVPAPPAVTLFDALASDDPAVMEAAVRSYVHHSRGGLP